MSEAVILLSSDDEDEAPSAKRLKPNAFDVNILEQLNKLKEITSTISEVGNCERNSVIKKNTEEINITITINDTTDNKKNGSVDSVSTTVILDSDSEEEQNVKEEKAPEKSAENIQIPESHLDEAKDKSTSRELEEKEIEDDFLNRPSTSTASDAHKLLDEFLEVCANSLRGSKYERKVLSLFTKLKENFDKCDTFHEESNFKRMLRECIIKAKQSPYEAVINFQRVYSYLLDHINGISMEVDENDLRKLKKLEKALKILMKKIKRLEEAEVNFSDDEDSVYIQTDVYIQRLNKIYNLYCKLLKRNPYAGRLLYERVQCVCSKYNEINRAVTKEYKNYKEKGFPSYHNIEKCVRKCNTENKLNLLEDAIKAESRACFTSMGNLLQMKRKRELYEVHSDFITLNEDPANTDETLKTKLQESLEEGSRKMKEVVEKYVKLQENNDTENNEKGDSSDDSDNSNYKDSESEGES